VRPRGGGPPLEGGRRSGRQKELTEDEKAVLKTVTAEDVEEVAPEAEELIKSQSVILAAASPDLMDPTVRKRLLERLCAAATEEPDQLAAWKAEQNQLRNSGCGKEYYMDSLPAMKQRDIPPDVMKAFEAAWHGPDAEGTIASRLWLPHVGDGPVKDKRGMLYASYPSFAPVVSSPRRLPDTRARWCVGFFCFR
jgi:hypothetical protein